MAKQKKATKVKARPRVTAPKASASTALVTLRSADIQRVKAELVQRLAEEGANVTGPTQIVSAGILGEDAAIGMVGQFDLRTTDAEEAVLSEAVNLEDVQIKPTGELYLPHEVYTRWFNRAFGRLGWSIVPAARPRTNSKTVVVPYVLYVHGKPAATAWGEQEYHEDNARQTLGDAVESTVASALRRIAKRLGVGLELWRRPWLERIVHERAVPVLVEVGYGEKRKTVTQWRLSNQRPLKGEIRPAGHGQREDRPNSSPSATDRGFREPAATPHAAGGSDGFSGAHITERQVKRLWAIAKEMQRDTREVSAWIKATYHVAPEGLTRRDYDAVCDALEAPGDLPRRS